MAFLQVLYKHEASLKAAELGPYYDSLWLAKKIGKMLTKRQARKRETDKYLL